MGFFDFFKSKTSEERQNERFQLLRKNTVVHEKRSIMHEMIITSDHDDSQMDVNPAGTGEFGLDITNPIPINGIDNIPAYMDKLRYEYISQANPNSKTYNPVTYLRTSNADTSQVGDKKSFDSIVASSTSCPNINGIIDVYNLYSISDIKLAKIYVNCYSLKTSNKVPKGFVHRDTTPPIRDGKLLMEMVKNSK
jgi:hypothetical protein